MVLRVTQVQGVYQFLQACKMLQDDVRNSGQPFAVGLTLEKLTAHTVDEEGKKTFVTHNPMDMLRKVMSCPMRLDQFARQCPARPSCKPAEALCVAGITAAAPGAVL